MKLPEPERIYASYPHQLSGGQRQRIMIAMALVLDPVLLIADEPTTALDVTTQAEILKLIAELQATEGTGVLFITHDFGVVAEIAHRVAVLRWGELVEMGPTEQILSRPEHGYTKMLISSVPSIHPQHRGVRKEGITVLRTEKLGKIYSGKQLLPEGARREGRGRRRPRHPQGRDAGHRGRIGLGQVDGGALHRPPDRSDRGQGLPGRHRDRHHVGRQAAPAPPQGADRLPGSLSLDESAHHRGRVRSSRGR